MLRSSLRHWIRFVALLVSASWSEQVTPSSNGLKVTYNDSVDGDGAPSLYYNNRLIVTGCAGLYGVSVTEGSMNYPWAHKVLNKTFVSVNSTDKLLTTVYNWGTIKVEHKLDLGATAKHHNNHDHQSLVGRQDHVMTKVETLDMNLMVTNNYNTTFSRMTVFAFGNLGPDGRWDFGECNVTGGGCDAVNIHDSMSPCPGSWHRPQEGGSPRCSMDVPQVLITDWGDGAVITTTPNNANINATVSFPWLAGGFRLAVELNDIPVGATRTFPLSLRFTKGSSGAPNKKILERAFLGIANDTFANYRKQRPNSVRWKDRRPLGALFPSDCGASCHCKSYSPQDCPNPRGWNFLPGKEAAFNVTSPEGVKAFQEAMLAYVNSSIQYCKYYLGGTRGNGPAACQGILMWCLAGQQYPQSTSWVGDPRLLPTLAPEMDGVADRLFKLITDSGLQCGMTLRPQAFTQNPLWNSSIPPMEHPFKYFQKHIVNPKDNSSDIDAIAQLIIDKASYAYKRWGCKLYYVDTTVDMHGHALDHTVWDMVHEALPDLLFFPEESSFSDYTSVTPLQNDWGGNALGTSPVVDFTYGRDAFSFELMQLTPGGSTSNNPSKKKIYDNRTLIENWIPLVQRGDILRVDAWYNSTTNVFVKQVYENAAAAAAVDHPLP